MTKESLQNQVDRAEALAAPTADDELRETLLKAAGEYRDQLNSAAPQRADGLAAILRLFE
ncbi:hypothetical protein ABIB06_007699 [Bradyrhizobium sp. LB8.2]|jgi:hypothetical protein|uniref:hypothetical protein n=1 Tax=unclassified Bradyrhizobium TaxID=2631580 RepID=UPI001FF8E00C|nr:MULTISPECIES: hypothetical protein [unclassified Bradyrhizobium]MCK1334654.1 hypothetical protein [Bradyrhizobium sp. 38]MCK1777109.1 hypothetical protein [Bradyrhizobium sp. 132]